MCNDNNFVRNEEGRCVRRDRVRCAAEDARKRDRRADRSAVSSRASAHSHARRVSPSLPSSCTCSRVEISFSLPVLFFFIHFSISIVVDFLIYYSFTLCRRFSSLFLIFFFCFFEMFIRLWFFEKNNAGHVVNTRRIVTYNIIITFVYTLDDYRTIV